MYIIEKRNKRLHITAGGDIIYTPPDFLRLVNRDRLRELANSFEQAGRRDIAAIVAFEKDTQCRVRR